MPDIPQDVIDAAQAADKEYEVPASVTIAQAILETGWFKSFPPGSNNYFGIKAVAGQPSVMTTTHEYVNGRYITIQAPFAKYDTLTDCFMAHGKLIADDPRYAPCFQAGDPEGFAEELQACGYATDPTYGKQLTELMGEHMLDQYDV